MITIYIDGSCLPKNPGGRMGWGFLVEEEGQTIYAGKGNKAASPSNTNNVAEYLALQHALEWLLKEKVKNSVLIRGDSQLVIQQMSGKWRIKQRGFYVPYAKQCKMLLKQFQRISFEWVPREKNTKADKLSKGHNVGIHIKRDEEVYNPALERDVIDSARRWGIRW